MEKKNENKSELFKKYWFVGLVAIMFVIFLVMFIVDDVKNQPKYVDTNKVDDKYTIYTLDDKNYFADDLYELLHRQLGVSVELEVFAYETLSQTMETTTEIDNMVANMVQYYLSQSSEEELHSQMVALGYNQSGIEGFREYCRTYIKKLYMTKDYYTANFDKFYDDIMTDLAPYNCYHILVMSEGDEPTDEQQAKIDAIKKALETQSFQEVAKTYSEDGSAQNGGFLGTIDATIAKNTYVSEFSEALSTLELDTVSEPVKSQYGYHFILKTAPTKEEVMSLLDDETFCGELNSLYTDNYIRAILEKAETVGFTINDERMQTAIDSLLESEAE